MTFNKFQPCVTFSLKTFMAENAVFTDTCGETAIKMWL